MEGMRKKMETERLRYEERDNGGGAFLSENVIILCSMDVERVVPRG